MTDEKNVGTQPAAEPDELELRVRRLESELAESRAFAGALAPKAQKLDRITRAVQEINAAVLRARLNLDEVYMALGVVAMNAVGTQAGIMIGDSRDAFIELANLALDQREAERAPKEEG